MPFVTSMATKMQILIASYEKQELSGSLYNAFLNRTVHFSNTCDMIAAMEHILDSLAFPQLSMQYRSFQKKASRKKVIEETGDNTMDNMEIPTSGKAKFVVHVQFRQNATWQGTIQWVEKKKVQKFRSALEMLKLMDEALAEADGVSDEAKFEIEES